MGEQLREAAKHQTYRRSRGLAQIIEGLRVDNILYGGRKPYSIHLENEDCMSSSGSSSCTGSIGSRSLTNNNKLSSSSSYSINKPSTMTTANTDNGSSHHIRTSYSSPKNQHIWTQINRID